MVDSRDTRVSTIQQSARFVEELEMVELQANVPPLSTPVHGYAQVRENGKLQVGGVLRGWSSIKLW